MGICRFDIICNWTRMLFCCCTWFYFSCMQQMNVLRCTSRLQVHWGRCVRCVCDWVVIFSSLCDSFFILQLFYLHSTFMKLCTFIWNINTFRFMNLSLSWNKYLWTLLLCFCMLVSVIAWWAPSCNTLVAAIGSILYIIYKSWGATKRR